MDANEDAERVAADGMGEDNADADQPETARMAWDELAAMRAKDLKKVLADLGEPTKGRRSELVARLWERLHGNEPPFDEARDEPATAADEVEPVAYAFATKVRCPRCGVIDNEATSTQGDTQYRRCRRGTCRKTFAVRGTAV